MEECIGITERRLGKWDRKKTLNEDQKALEGLGEAGGEMDAGRRRGGEYEGELAL